MNTRLDDALKRNGDAVFAPIGLSPSEVVRSVWEYADQHSEVPAVVAAAISQNPGSASAIREVAWSCVRNLRRLAYVVPADDSDVVEAAIMRADHTDFEGNLIIAAARRMQADCVVTSNAVLLANFPDLCADMEMALQLIADPLQASCRNVVGEPA